MSAPAPALQALVEIPGPAAIRRKLDFWMLAGVVVAIGAVCAGIAYSGVSLKSFLQPTGLLIVLGGTLGVVFIATPRQSLLRSIRAAVELIRTRSDQREELMEELVALSKAMRPKGLFVIERVIAKASRPFLRECLVLAMDARHRDELQAMLETKLRQVEKQGESDARVFEVAGGFAPTIGVLGTVVGLMDVLKQFSNISSVAAGTGTAFISTIYGLALANLILLPWAQRMRAQVADRFETNEMIVEGTLCLFDSVHPALVRDRLNCFLRPGEAV